MDFLQDYVKNLELGGKSQATIRTYKKDIGKLISHFSIKDKESLDRLSVSDFQSFYTSQNITPVSLNGLIRSLSAFFTWLKGIDYIQDNAFFHVKFGKTKFVSVKKEHKVILTDEEARELISAADNIQDKFMLALMLSTGLRRDEVGKIKITDIKDCTIIINGKGNKQRKTFLNDTLCHMLNMYMAERKTDSPFLFYATRGNVSSSGQLTGSAVNDRVKACAKKANIDPEKAKKVSAHRLRGTLLTNVIRQFGIRAAQSVAGHASMNTTMLYDESGDEITRDVLLGMGTKFEEIVNAK